MSRQAKSRNAARRRLCLVAAIVWMAVIFLFSSHAGEQSSVDSGRASEAIGEIFVKGYREWEPARKQVFRGEIEHFVRKCAHFSEYAILAMLWLGAILPTMDDWRRLRFYLFAWCAAVLYALTDECHQRFVTERTGSMIDVGIDGAGALTGLLVVCLVCAVWHRLAGKDCGRRAENGNRRRKNSGLY